ncbi:sigma factor [Microvirga yunnanensis]|uniref:sigma factor n=1 Tax=Microvirga yunnanensis TaxID=2953740 RepID=UPI0021C9495D|nr:sigma factor [Microvirga sp. HBU65207]
MPPLTNDRDRADDLVQDTIPRPWANADTFKRGADLNAWLFTILRNLFRSECRKYKRELVRPRRSPRRAPQKASGPTEPARRRGPSLSLGDAMGCSTGSEPRGSWGNVPSGGRPG